MTKMLDPLGLLNSPFVTTASTKAEVARMENTRIGVCPVCQQPMKSIIAAGIDSYVCMEHRVCVPKENE